MLGAGATRYAKVGDDYVAYQAVGAGPRDLVFVPHWNSNVEALWDFPPLARFVRRLSDAGRVILCRAAGDAVLPALRESRRGLRHAKPLARARRRSRAVRRAGAHARHPPP